jgi:polyphenol oxidase
MNNYLIPNWPQPTNIKAYTTLRFHPEGKSIAPYDNFNLATHVDDNKDHVLTNRKILIRDLKLPEEPLWLTQEHTTTVLAIDKNTLNSAPIADASYTTEKNRVCVVLTADCVPILLCDREGTIVAAIHAGWKGLCNGVIEETLKTMPISGNKLMAWLGPAIGPKAFRVGEEVRAQLIAQDKKAELAFKRVSENEWLGDLFLIAKQRLNDYEVTKTYGGDLCTFSEQKKFFSYRRSVNGITGRMATLIWIV